MHAIPVWFDIDGTLLHTKAGHGAFRDALLDVYGWEDNLEEIVFAGNTDLGVLLQLARKHRGCPQETLHNSIRFFERMGAHLHKGLEIRKPDLVPGAPQLVDLLAAREDVILRLITGNARICALIKLQHAGFPAHLSEGGFGDQHPDRNEIARLAHETLHGEWPHPAPPARGLVIGDTVRDILAAQAIGARCLAVASGADPAEDLLSAGADRVVTNLHPAPDLLDWIFEGLPGNR